MVKGGLIAVTDFSGVPEDEYHDWYDQEHIPERLRVPGFLSAQRWISVDNDRHAVGIYDLDDVEVLDSAPYRAIAGANISPWSKRIARTAKRVMRSEGILLVPGQQAAPTGAGGLLLFAANIEPGIEDDFNDWYDSEHLPALKAVPGVICARRYRARSGGTHSYYALYHLASPDIPLSQAWTQASETEWSARIRPHFRDRLRIVCKPYVRAQ